MKKIINISNISKIGKNCSNNIIRRDINNLNKKLILNNDILTNMNKKLTLYKNTINNIENTNNMLIHKNNNVISILNNINGSQKNIINTYYRDKERNESYIEDSNVIIKILMLANAIQFTFIVINYLYI